MPLWEIRGKGFDLIDSIDNTTKKSHKSYKWTFKISEFFHHLVVKSPYVEYQRLKSG